MDKYNIQHIFFFNIYNMSDTVLVTINHGQVLHVFRLKVFRKYWLQVPELFFSFVFVCMCGKVIWDNEYDHTMEMESLDMYIVITDFNVPACILYCMKV